MRLLPQVSQPTLESFRKDVYRPRLALLLLILLLHDGGTKNLNSSLSTEAYTSSSASLPTPAVSASSTHAFDSIRTYFSKIDRQFDSLHFLNHRKDGQKNLKRGSPRSTGKRSARQSRKDSKVSISPASRKRKRKASSTPSFQSVLQLPRILFDDIFQGDILCAIVPLHILWIIRLGGMMIEDSIVRTSIHAKGNNHHSGGPGQGTTLAKISTLAFLALGVPSLSRSKYFKEAMSLLSSNREFKATTSQTTFPLQFIIFLELSATLLSLLCPLMKLNSSKMLGQYLPTKILLPSPSHSPSLVELLPLPPGLADIISGNAADSQSRPNNRRNLARRPGAANLVLAPARREALMDEQDQRNPERWVNGMQDPLVLPENASAPNGTKRVKAPRRSGVTVEVDSCWLLENVVVLWGAFVGAIAYLSIVLSLPTLSPISFPPVVALLSLRSQLSAIVITWTSARRAVECLEFVRRRWVGYNSSDPSSEEIPTSSPTSTNRRWQPDAEDDVFCPICFELIRAKKSSSSGVLSNRVGAESCRLDCGHELHAVCLVQIFLGNKQAYCPCCHDPLKATPPGAQVVATTSTERP